MSLLIKDTTREEWEQIIRQSLDCGGECENCSSCWLGGGNPFDMYQDYIDGKKKSNRLMQSIMRGISVVSIRYFKSKNKQLVCEKISISQIRNSIDRIKSVAYNLKHIKPINKL